MNYFIEVVALALALTFALASCWMVYNITFHPLAHVPGPKLAAMTRLYQTFWSYFNGRSIYYRKVAQMHLSYGPVVRIAPNEISLQDKEDWETAYSVHSGYQKDGNFYRVMGAPEGMFGAVTKAQHKVLRCPWAEAFKRPSIYRLYDKIEDRVKRLHEAMTRELGKSRPIPIQTLLHAMTMDIVSECTLGEPLGLLEDPDRAEQCTSEILNRARWIWILMSNPVVFWVLHGLSTAMSRVPAWKTELNVLFQLSAQAAKCFLEGGSNGKGPKILPRMPDGAVLSRKSIVDDLYSFNVAGAFNLGTTTSITFYYILSNPSILRRLRDELEHVDFETSTPENLQGLRYLTACMMEGLRLGYGPIGRLPRVVPASGAEFRGLQVPAGTVVGVWSFVQHHDPDIWGDDHATFNPDRWLDEKRFGERRSCLMAFGVDRRQCIGRELAELTMRLTLTMLAKEWSNCTIHGDFSPHDLDDYFASLIPKDRPLLTICNDCCARPKWEANLAILKE